jgi:hypothetical protein
MRANLFVLIALLSTIIYIGCATDNVKTEKNFIASNEERVNAQLKKILEINNNSPNSFTAQFTIDGQMSNNKNFKSMGNAVFNKKPKKIKITFFDFVFKSPLTIMVQDEKIIKFYFPMDKKLFLDNEDRISLRNYTNIDLNFKFLSGLIMGIIPLIDNYAIKQSLTEKGEPADKSREFYIILENDDLFETISIKNNLPDKILLVNKRSKEKVEFYLEEPQYKNNILYYKNIRFISQNSGDKINLKFSNIKYNISIDLKDASYIKIPKDVKVIPVN